MTVIVDLPAATQALSTDTMIIDNAVQTQQVPFQAIQRDVHPAEVIVDSAPVAARYLDITTGAPHKIIHYKDVPSTAPIQHIYISPTPADLGNNTTYRLTIFISTSGAAGLKLGATIAQVHAPAGWLINGNWTSWAFSINAAWSWVAAQFTIVPAASAMFTI